MNGAPSACGALSAASRADLRGAAAEMARRKVQRLSGRVVRVVGLEIEVVGIRGAIGDVMWLGEAAVPAEVIAIRDGAIVLMVIGSVEGIAAGDRVVAAGAPLQVAVGDGLVGRVVDALGAPIDGKGPIVGGRVLVDLNGRVPNPMARGRITEPLPLGVRVVDMMLTCGQGQRVGIFAGSGVGKSTLLGMMARGTEADVVVVGLVGERGREVREFLEDDLGPAGQARSVVVVATSDQPALMRLRAAMTATRIAEHFADEGLRVLLLVDSLTRVAYAQRDIGLAAGEPPTTRGYTPSVFSLLPQLLERAGPRERGSITGIYTVLVEGDDMNEPVADHARSILDGHIVLSRRLGAMGHYPTVAVLESASRLAGKLVTPERLASVRHLRALLSAWEEGRDLVEIGAYQPGTNDDLDEFLARRRAIDDFLRQDAAEVSDYETAWGHLAVLLAEPVERAAPLVPAPR
jgi:flagellum-specific ATP synthase